MSYTIKNFIFIFNNKFNNIFKFKNKIIFFIICKSKLICKLTDINLHNIFQPQMYTNIFHPKCIQTLSILTQLELTPL